ncbi:MAG: hypothetical protein IJA15_03800, partial [Clostridia bacterium]|nr:hypothetical protein [Clostridia bacterium]
AEKSGYNSGIISTKADDYAAIAEKAGFHKVDGSDEYFNPGTPFDYGYLADGSYYEWNAEDTDDNEPNEDKLVMKGDKVLMIHNEVKGTDGKANGEGTAQKFTSSSSLSLARHEYAKLSIWVLTHDLKSAYKAEGEFGAYIAVQNTVSSSVAPLVIKNIDTESQWAKYTLYLSASDFATSSFKVVVGLGFGSKEIRADYVEGFAYFDNANFEIIDKAEYDAGVATVDAKYSIYNDDNSLKEKIEVNEGAVTYTANDKAANTSYTERSFVLSHTRANAAISGYTVEGGTITHNHSTSSDVTFGDFASELGAPVTKGLHIKHDSPATTSYTTKALSVDEGKHLKVSFWVKAEVKLLNQAALTVTLNDYGTDKTLKAEPAKTVVASNVNTNEYENKNYNNWIEYVVFISNTLNADNTAEETRYFTLTFDFGTTSATPPSSWDLTEGFAAITDLQGYEMTEEDYNIADTSSYTYSKKLSLSADRPNGIEGEDERVDSYVFKHGVNDIDTTVPATNVIGYTGVVGGSTYVGGENVTEYAAPGKVVNGVVNSKNTYTDTAINTHLAGLGKTGENKNVQALMIQTKDTVSYGYVGSASTIAAGTSTLISVKVHVEGDATAYIYLASSDALSIPAFQVLGINAEAQKLVNGKLEADTANDVKENFVVTVDKNTANAENGWVTVNLVITAGDEALSYRVELWNGERNGTATPGYVYFDGLTTTTAPSVEVLLQNLEGDFGADFDANKVEKSFTRVPSLVKYTKEDGTTAEKYREYESTVVYQYLPNCSTKIFDLTTVHAPSELDETTSVEEDEEDETVDSSTDTSAETSFSWALQLTSIIIAAVLVALLIIVLVRMLVKKYRKNKGSAVSYYNRNSREQAGLAIEAKKARMAKAQAEKEEELISADEQTSTYDYDNIENNIEEEVTEEVTEAPAEEAPVEEVAEEIPAEETVENVAEEVTEAPATTSEEDVKPE